MAEHYSKSRSPASHGGNILATAKELGCPISELIDMSSNLTPLGIIPGLQEVLTGRLDEIGYLPETGSDTLSNMFAAKYDLSASQVLVGNGTTEYIYAIPAATQPERAIIINPTYSDYHLACQWAGIQVDNFALQEDDDFNLDLGTLGSVLHGRELVFLCNPNNPTGFVTPSAELYQFIQDHPETMFLVDESYLPFVRESSLLRFPIPDNLFVLASFSKIFCIPGLRLGFLVSAEKNMRVMAKRRKPWGVNRMAQIAGEYVLSKGDQYIEEVMQFLERERPRFINCLLELPHVEVIQGRANFILCCLTGPIRAPQLRQELLQHRVMIRNCDNFFGLDDRYFRMSLKERPDNDVCLNALRNILEGAP